MRKSPYKFFGDIVKVALARNTVLAAIGMLALFTSVVPPAPAAQVNAVDRQVIVTVLSWYSPIGALNGSRWWSKSGYAYEGSKASKGVENYPLTGISLPKLAPKVGSPEFYQLQYLAAQSDLRQMRLAGFDVAAFDMLPMPAFDPAKPLDDVNVPFTHYQTFLRWLKAGEDENMKVALFADIKNKSADYPAGRTLNVQEWVNVLSGALDDVGPAAAALWRIDGRPVVFHFGTDASAGAPPQEGAGKPDGGWQQVLQALRDSGRSFYFIADVRPTLFGGMQKWSRIADAVYMFAPASPASFMVEKQAEMSNSFTVPFIWSVSPGYFNEAVNAYTEPGFRRIHDTYLAAMKAGAKYMNVLTWNDFGEDTDIAPSANKGRALLDVFSFYNHWFKSGTQPAADDKVVVAYPVRIPTAVRTRSPVYGMGKWASPPYAPKVFYWANITSGRTLEVPGIGKRDLPAGLSMGVLGMASPGDLNAILGGQTIPLPAIQRTAVERQRTGSGGLEYRYVTLP